MSYYVVVSHAKAHLQAAKKQLGTDGLDALDRVIERILDEAMRLSNSHARVGATEIEVAAGMSRLAIQARGR